MRTKLCDFKEHFDLLRTRNQSANQLTPERRQSVRGICELKTLSQTSRARNRRSNWPSTHQALQLTGAQRLRSAWRSIAWHSGRKLLILLVAIGNPAMATTEENDKLLMVTSSEASLNNFMRFSGNLALRPRAQLS
jgi:hypothetical protein